MSWAIQILTLPLTPHGQIDSRIANIFVQKILQEIILIFNKKNMNRKKVEAGRKCSVSLESSQLHWDEAADVSQYFIMSFN